MNFETDAQRACYERVSDYMSQLFGESAQPIEEAPVFVMQSGSAVLNVSVQPWGDDDAVVFATSWVVTDVDPTPELHRFLLEANYNMRFGAFAIDQEDDILFSYSAVGSTIDKEEIRALALAVLGTADDYDDEITKRFGGVSARDRVATS